MNNLLQDLRFAVRMLLKKPGFMVIAVVTLAAGVGANTAIFSVVNAVLLRPLPFPDSDQLVVVLTKSSKEPRSWVTYPDLVDWRNQSETLSEFSAFVGQSVNLTGGEEPTRVVGSFVSANFFKTLKTEAAEGRTFLPNEDLPSADRVVVVSHPLWRDRFGSDPGLIGRSLTLNGKPFTVVGILPEEFRFQWVDAEVWMPLPHYPNFVEDRSRPVAAVIGRLQPGVNVEQARSEMNTIASRLAEQYPETNATRAIVLESFQKFITEDIRPSLMILLVVVGCVLLIACANVANLMLSRSASREKELAVRAALGAGRMRIVRQLLTESLLLSFVGGAAGLAAGVWGAEALAANSPTSLPPGVELKLDLSVLGFTLGLTLVTAILFGIAPALKYSNSDLNVALKEGARGTSGGTGKLRGALVISQVTLSVVLLIGSGLMIRSFANLIRVSPGFNAANLLTMEYRVPRDKYPEPARQWEFHRRVVEGVRALPGVQSASVVLALPYSGNFGTIDFVPLDHPDPPKGQEPRAQRNTADQYYFDTMQITVMRGRTFTDQDRPGSPAVIVINQTMADRYWPGADPIGKQVRLIGEGVAGANRVASIVGVVGDVKHNGLDDASASQIYVAYAQNPFIFATLVVKTESDPMARANDVRSVVWTVDKDQPVWKVRTLESLIDRSIGPRRFVMTLLAGFAGLAMLLAAIGIYGVMSYMVSQRTTEIGIRMALGANQKSVLGIVLRRAIILTGCGLAAGVVSALLAGRLLTTFLFGVDSWDPITFAFVGIVLAVVALVACYVPARNALRVDPIVALRYE